MMEENQVIHLIGCKCKYCINGQDPGTVTCTEEEMKKVVIPAWKRSKNFRDRYGVKA